MTPDPTPQPAHDHGAAGFCTDHGLRVPAENGAGFWPALAGQNDRDAWMFMAERDTARDESARLRASADAWWTEYDRELTAHEATKAEVERLTRIVNGYDRTPAERTDDDH